MQVTTADEMPLYVPPEKPWVLRLRSTESFQERLEGVVRLWQKLAESQGDDPKQIDISYVVRRILDAGIDTAFQEFGGEPKSEESWKAVEKQITAASVAAAKKSSK